MIINSIQATMLIGLITGHYRCLTRKLKGTEKPKLAWTFHGATPPETKLTRVSIFRSKNQKSRLWFALCLIRCLRYSGSRCASAATTDKLRYWWHDMDVVLLIPAWSLPVRQSQNRLITGIIDEIWCSAGICSWSNTISVVHSWCC